MQKWRGPEDGSESVVLTAAEAAAAKVPDDYWSLLGRRKFTALGFCVLGLAAGYLYSRSQTPLYSARASIEVQNVNHNYLNISDVDPHSSNLPDEYYVPTQLALLQSESLIDQVHRKLEGSGPAEKKEYLHALAIAASTVRARSPNLTRIIEINVDSTDPQVAATFANSLAEEFIQQDVESRLKDSRRTRDLLNEQSQELMTKLQASESRLQAYTRESGLLMIGEKSSVAEGKLQQLQQQLSEAHAEEVTKRSKYDTAKPAGSEAAGARLEDGPTRDYRAKLTELKRQLAQQSVLLAPGHYKIQRLQAEIGELESALVRERNDNLERLQSDYDAASRREKLLSEAYSNQVKLVSGLAVKAIHYNILKDEITAGRQLYETMLQKLKEASIAAAVRPSNARFVDPARPPALPYKPDMKTNVSLGLVTGLLLGSVWISVRERRNENLRTPEEIQGIVNLVGLGTIPSANLARRPEAAALLAESFRSILTSILLAEREGQPVKVLVVTSPGPGEGKTLMVTNLGSALAESRRKVLLIDADTRNPQLHVRFGLTREPGLGDILLSQEAITVETIKAVVKKTSVPGVSLLPAGSIGPAVSTSFYSARMKQILETCGQAFDNVLVDTPPMLYFSDARALGRQSDAVILVFRANRTSRQAAQIAGQRLAEDASKILGTILNDWTPRRASIGRYYKNYATGDAQH